jgi:hypothetical protein
MKFWLLLLAAVLAGAGTAAALSSRGDGDTPVAPAAAAAAQGTDGATPATDPPAQATAWSLPKAPPGPHFLIGRVDRTIRTTAGRVRPWTALGSQTWLLIVRHRGHVGWALVPGDPMSHMARVDLRQLDLRWTGVRVDVDVTSLTLAVKDGRRTLGRFPVAVGRPTSPTPRGRFSVTDRVSFKAGGPYGTFALGLSAHQTAGLPAGWTGGDQVAIHGTDNPSSIGAYASLGCVRVGSAALRLLEKTVPLGAPVIVHA